MASLNKWLGYIDRSYEQIKGSLISGLQASVPEMTDYSESNIFVVLISMFAAIAEMLNYYIDNWARESYLETASLYASGYKLTRLTDYRTKSWIAATVDVTFTIVDGSDNPFPVTAAYTIPAGTIISTQSGVKFITLSSAEFAIGESAKSVPARQGESQIAVSLGTTSGIYGQAIQIIDQYSEGTMNLSIGADVWLLVNTMAFSSLVDKHYITEVKDNGLPYVIIGGLFNGYTPSVGLSVIGTYEICDGASANKISPNTITEIDTALTNPVGSSGITVTNPLSPSGGADIESLASIKVRAPLDTRTQERGVTFQDFIDLAKLVPGVKDAKLGYCCGATADVYIAPEGGGIASSFLLNTVDEYFLCRKIFTIKADYFKAGTTRIILRADIYGKYRFSPEVVYAAAVAALEAEYGYDNSEINRPIRLSDIYGTLEVVKEIDYVDNLVIYTEPYARPLNSDTELTWTRETLTGSTERIKWKLIYGVTGFQIIKNDLYITTWPIGVEYIDPLNIIKFTIGAGLYSSGMEWEFYTYPYNDDLMIDDFTVPVIDETTVIITAHSQNKSFTCKPNC